MNVEFTGQYRWASDGWVSFRAIVDGKSVTNRVASEALKDHFVSDGTRPSDEGAYLQFQDSIEAVARQMLAAGKKNQFGGADVTTRDLRAFLDTQEE